MRSILKSGLSPFSALALFFGLAAAGNAQTTFSLPVTQNQANYRQFDYVLQTQNGPKYHAGADYYCADLKVMASNCGIVNAMIPDGAGAAGFGNTVILRHTLQNGTRVYTQYSHLASFKSGLTVGQNVSRGDLLGTMGKTGNSNGIVHLHFEMKVQGVLGNPLRVGTVAPQTCWGYVPVYAGNICVGSATAYGYYNPNAWYGSGICWAGLSQR